MSDNNILDNPNLTNDNFAPNPKLIITSCILCNEIQITNHDMFSASKYICNGCMPALQLIRSMHVCILKFDNIEWNGFKDYILDDLESFFKQHITNQDSNQEQYHEINDEIEVDHESDQDSDLDNNLDYNDEKTKDVNFNSIIPNSTPNSNDVVSYSNCSIYDCIICNESNQLHTISPLICNGCMSIFQWLAVMQDIVKYNKNITWAQFSEFMVNHMGQFFDKYLVIASIKNKNNIGNLNLNRKIINKCIVCNNQSFDKQLMFITNPLICCKCIVLVKQASSIGDKLEENEKISWSEFIQFILNGCLIDTPKDDTKLLNNAATGIGTSTITNFNIDYNPNPNPNINYNLDCNFNNDNNNSIPINNNNSIQIAGMEQDNFINNNFNVNFNNNSNYNNNSNTNVDYNHGMND